MVTITSPAPTTRGREKETRSHVRRWLIGGIALVLALAAVLAVVLTGQSTDGSSTPAPHHAAQPVTPPVKPAPVKPASVTPSAPVKPAPVAPAPVAPVTPPTVVPGNAPASAIAAINAWETQNGPPVGTWVVSSANVSSGNPTWVMFKIGAAPAYEAKVQGGYGFAQQLGATWSVVGFGSADVGCAIPGSTTPVVPTPVLSSFGIVCPTVTPAPASTPTAPASAA